MNCELEKTKVDLWVSRQWLCISTSRMPHQILRLQILCGHLKCRINLMTFIQPCGQTYSETPNNGNVQRPNQYSAIVYWYNCHHLESCAYIILQDFTDTLSITSNFKAWTELFPVLNWATALQPSTHIFSPMYLSAAASYHLWISLVTTNEVLFDLP